LIETPIAIGELAGQQGETHAGGEFLPFRVGRQTPSIAQLSRYENERAPQRLGSDRHPTLKGHCLDLHRRQRIRGPLLKLRLRGIQPQSKDAEKQPQTHFSHAGCLAALIRE